MNNLKEIITIQKYIRRFIIRKNILIPQSSYQTKTWRKNRIWYKNGKSNECEKYQIELINKIIKEKIAKTNDRINMESYDIVNNKQPISKDDGYEWTENFDGKLFKNRNTYYFNLKFVCDSGGFQTRTLRELYHFIKCQLEYLNKHNSYTRYFINILDGDTSYNNMNKFIFLINKEKYKKIKNNIFVGSLFDFQKKSIINVKVIN